MSLARKPGLAPLEDLDGLPPTWRAEILDGKLYAFPRPYADHSVLVGGILVDLLTSFSRRDGWWILREPGIRNERSPEYSPDICGWRRARMPQLFGSGSLTITPDWICEVLSPETRRYDMLIKRRFYAEIGVPYLWYVDLQDRTLTVSELQDGHWVELGIHGPDEKIRAEPFTAVELDLRHWWEDLRDLEDDADSAP